MTPDELISTIQQTLSTADASVIASVQAVLTSLATPVTPTPTTPTLTDSQVAAINSAIQTLQALLP